jgi:tRNA A-37 threonylcarbamoyl transferase component Bud32/HAMP domain-containing protein
MEKVGRYQIREVIGEGAMAKVYKAFDPEIDRTLAIKLLKSQLRGDSEYRLRFLREAKGAGVLSHPNIVTVFDVGEADSHPYIAMEFIEGPTLAEILKEKDPLPARTVVDIGIQLSRALDYAHRKGIVHRDVKPGNVMLTKDTNVVKVADFGICRMDNSDATQQTQVGSVLGTPHYMSPEQVLGQKVDARSDLFAAGVVLYQLLTGHLPFDGDTLISVAYKITNTDPPAIDKLRPDLPLSLRRIVDRSLRKQPEKRFQSGEELAKALIGVAQEMAEAEKIKERGRVIPMRVRWALLMAALVAVTMTITAGFIYKRLQQAMMEQVMSYGESMAKFMATQNAVPLLSEDWAATEVFIAETIGRQDFTYIVVIDHQGLIRGTSSPARIGDKYIPPKSEPVPTRDQDVVVQSHHLPEGLDVLDFAAPVLFQGKRIGEVHLGIYETPLKEVANLSLWLLGLLTLVTSAAVAGGSYLLAQRLSGPIRVLRNSLSELAQGHYDYRISDSRKDEFGELYAAFDQTAEALQQRHEPASPPPG